MTALEIQRELDITMTAIRNCLYRMHKHHMVEMVVLTKEEVKRKGIRFSGTHYAWKVIEDETEI